MASKFKVGDLVILDPELSQSKYAGVVFRVTRVLPVNLVAEPINGGRPVRANSDIWLPAPAQDETKTAAGTAVMVDIPEYRPPLYAGAIVTVAGPGWRESTTDLYVVLGDSSVRAAEGDFYKIARLGGEEGRYWSKIPRKFLTEIALSRITVAE